MTPRCSLGRLARAEDFRAIYREGARHTTAHLVVYARPTATGTVRLGVVVGRRFGGAVVRNRLKRRLREAARPLVRQVRGGTDIVLAPRAGAPEVSFQALRDSVKAGLAGVKILPRETEGS